MKFLSKNNAILGLSSLIALSAQLPAFAQSPNQTYTCPELFIRNSIAQDQRLKTVIKVAEVPAAIIAAGIGGGGFLAFGPLGAAAVGVAIGAAVGSSVFVGMAADGFIEPQGSSNRSFSALISAPENSNNDAEKEQLMAEITQSYQGELTDHGSRRLKEIQKDVTKCAKKRGITVSNELVSDLIVQGFSDGTFCDMGRFQNQYANLREIREIVMTEAGCRK